MPSNHSNSPVCLLLTATVQVKQSMIFTERRDTNTRLEDYKKALALWLDTPEITSIVFVENSGFDLCELVELANKVPGKKVEFLSFECPDFDGSLGKGYGEMLCFEHCIQHSKLMADSPRFLKVSGRYYLRNVSAMLQFIDARPDAIVICDMLNNLTWADSRAFGGHTEFLRSSLCPMIHELNDSNGSYLEHVLARAAHHVMANSGTWALPPFPLQIQGVSGTGGDEWHQKPIPKLKRRIRQALLAKCLSSGPI
jgi:hypothetical protein